MTHPRRWTLAAAALVALLAAAWLALWALLPGEDALARRIEAEFEARLGQPLKVGAVHWRLWGAPMLEVRDAHTVQPEPIRVRRIALYPQLLPLLRGALVLDRVEVDGAWVPRDALAAYRGRGAGEAKRVHVRAVAFTDATYVSYSGIPVAYDGEIQWDEDRLPARVRLSRPDAAAEASLEATRNGRTEDGADRYQLRLQAGGGSALGQARLTTTDNGGMRLTGELEPREVEISALLATFHRRSPLGGLASGQTELRAEGDTLQQLFRSLRTRSELQVERARLLRFDLDKAVKSLGKDRAGETPLESLRGVVATQNTAQGLRSEFTEVKAVAGPYTGTGQATLYRQQIEAQGVLALAGGVVDVPFAAKGPTRAPDVDIAWGSLAGAAVGTAVLPGIGTVIGAKIGGVLGGPPQPGQGKASGERVRR
jgi:hypothetical protein